MTLQPKVLTVYDRMLVTPELQDEIERIFGAEYRSALEEDDIEKAQRILNLAWRHYLNHVHTYLQGDYDPHSGKTFGNKMFSPACLMYRHYFGQLPPPNQRTILDETLEQVGMEGMSKVMSEWLEKKWNPRNIYGMVAKAKRDSREYPVLQSVAEVFISSDEEE